MTIVTSGLILGLVFGVVLQRGSFCGSSLLSTAVLHRDLRGLAGIAAAVLVSMIGFATLAHLDLVVINPKPMRLASAIAGGALFGVGMVLAGGCVTGTLYKAGEGRVTSLLALPGIAFGAVVMDHGAGTALKTALVQWTKSTRPPAGLDEVAQLPFPLLAGGLGILGVAVLGVALRLMWKPGSGGGSGSWSRRSLSPITAGVLVGVLGWIAYPLSTAAGRNYPLGGMGGVKGAFAWLTTGEIEGSAWLVALVGGIVLGSMVSAVVQRTWKLRSADATTLLLALAGGVLVGAGASIGRGCFIGNGVSGLALLSLHSIVFACCMLVANWVTTVVYLRGLR